MYNRGQYLEYHQCRECLEKHYGSLDRPLFRQIEEHTLRSYVVEMKVFALLQL